MSKSPTREKVSITAEPTVSEPHHPLADDAQASLRGELLDQLAAGHATIAAALAEFANADPTVREQLRTQLSAIAGLRQQIGTASVAALGALKAQIVTIVGNAAAVAQEAETSALASSSSAVGMGMFASAAREQVNAVLAGMKDFEPYLKFASPDDEAEYRKREAERRAYIKEQQAKHTPQDDLNAAGGAVGQMADAAAHGAGDSPEFQQRWDKLVDSTAKLREQIVRDGGNVAEFDARLREDLRHIMKSKGLSDAQIDEQFAAHPGDPLEAAKAFVAEEKGVIGEREIGDLSRKARNYKDDAGEKPTVTYVTTPQPDVPASALDAMADLKALGVVATAHDANVPPAHGVTASIAANSKQGVNFRS